MLKWACMICLVPCSQHLCILLFWFFPRWVSEKAAFPNWTCNEFGALLRRRRVGDLRPVIRSGTGSLCWILDAWDPKWSCVDITFIVCVWFFLLHSISLRFSPSHFYYAPSNLAVDAPGVSRCCILALDARDGWTAHHDDQRFHHGKIRATACDWSIASFAPNQLLWF